jgi:glutamine cyclotransferase
MDLLLIAVLALQGTTAHVQGIDTDGDRLWVTSVDRDARKGFLQEYSLRDGRLERSIEVQDGDRYHPGGIAADADSIWMPVAEYKANSSAVIQKRNKKTFAVELQFAVADHIGCVAVTPEFVIGGNWDSRDFYVWDHAGKLIRKVSSETGNAYQDLKFADGKLVGSGTLAGRKGAIDWLEMPSMKLARRLPVGNTDKGEPLTREGMTLRGNQVWLLPEDGASRLMMFALP